MALVTELNLKLEGLIVFCGFGSLETVDEVHIAVSV